MSRKDLRGSGLQAYSREVARPEEPAMKFARARFRIVERTALGWVQIGDASLDEPDCVQQKLKRFWEEWLAMSWISVKVTGTND